MSGETFWRVASYTSEPAPNALPVGAITMWRPVGKHVYDTPAAAGLGVHFNRDTGEFSSPIWEQVKDPRTPGGAEF